jgi:hypothetical protein
MTKTEATADTKTAAAAGQDARVAPERDVSQEATSQKKRASKANQGAKKAAPTKEAKPAARKRATTRKPAAQKAPKPAGKKTPQPPTEARQGSKKATILELLRRPKGASLAEIAKATHWQNHSIRGFLSGALRKKLGLTVESSKDESGLRTYRIRK